MRAIFVCSLPVPEAWEFCGLSYLLTQNAPITTGTTLTSTSHIFWSLLPSVLGIFHASCVPSCWCCCHLGLLHLSPLELSGLSTLTQLFLCVMPSTWLWSSMCVLPACICTPLLCIGIFIQPAPRVLSGVHPILYQSCTQHLLSCADIISAAMLCISPVFSRLWCVLLIWATTPSVSLWYMPYRLSFHDGSSSSSFSSLCFCCLSRSSPRAIFPIYSWIFVISSWIVALMLASLQTPSFFLVYSLRVLDLYCEELSCLCISSFYLLFCPYYYTSYDHQQDLDVDGSSLVLTIQLIIQNPPHSM